jgi:hypothetical protein
MRAFLLTLAALAVVAIIPGLWFGASLADETSILWLFPLPSLLCVAVAGVSCHVAEDVL